VKGFWKDSPASGGTATIAPTVKESVPLLRDKQSLTENGDLNAIVTPGTYACSDAVAKTLTNSPSAVGFTMDVSESYDMSDYITQQLYLPYDGIEYRRRHRVSNGSWTAWRQNRFHIGTGDCKVLCETAGYMTADQTINLSESVSSQPNGIVLVWSEYTSGAAQNSGWSYFFVPKHRVTAGWSTGGLNCTAIHYGGSSTMTKYVYVHDTKIIGNDLNNDTNSNSFAPLANNRFVLRYVLGV
jgi:hypothetical protein